MYTLPMTTTNTGLSAPMKLSEELAAIVGADQMSRPEVTKQLWVYIKKHDLQDPADKRTIVADEKLLKIFGGEKKVNMMKLAGFVSKHVSKI